MMLCISHDLRLAEWWLFRRPQRLSQLRAGEGLGEPFLEGLPGAKSRGASAGDCDEEAVGGVWGIGGRLR